MKPARIHGKRTASPEDRLARRLLSIGRAARVHAVLCVAESAAMCERVKAGSGKLRLLAASASRKACRDLAGQGFETLLLPLRFISRFKQAQYAVAMALQKGRVSPGERLVCSVGSSQARGEFILVLEVGQESSSLALQELVKSADDVSLPVIEAAIDVACEIARAARRGKRLGAIFVLGDSASVLDGSRQLVPNPFQNLALQERSLLSPSIRDLLVELAKLDGAFVARQDGVIETAGAFLVASPADVRVPQGLGTRHLTAAAITARTRTTAVVVSATDGHIRVFKRGELVMHVDPVSL
ncbi:MAG: diadenylate cyclase [Verrucomicrobia bacterium]|jgi:DNA integrity scanning protein DisA with diadenylate cyclase activity|nr:diadenylate cyclase [Verrucomicrobiota bacterium]